MELSKVKELRGLKRLHKRQSLWAKSQSVSRSGSRSVIQLASQSVSSSVSQSVSEEKGGL